MSEPTTFADQVDEVVDGVVHWTVQDDRINFRSDAYAVETPDGKVLIDPLPLSPEAAAALGKVAAICLTEGQHQRSAWRLRKRLGVPVWAPEGAHQIEETPDHWYVDGDILPGGVRAVETSGFGTVHCALFLEREAGVTVVFSGDLVVRDAAKVILTGLSQSTDFPVTKNAYQDELLAEQNAVLMQLLPLPHIPKKAQIEYSTYCGGTVKDAANGVYLMRSGDIVISGVTLSPDYPTTDGSVLNGDSDLFLTRLDTSRKPENQLVFSTLFGGSSGEGLCVGPVGNGFGEVYIGGDTFSDDLPGTGGTYDEFHDGVSYDAFVAGYYLGGLGD